MSIELYFTNIREKEDEIRKYTILFGKIRNNVLIFVQIDEPKIT